MITVNPQHTDPEMPRKVRRSTSLWVVLLVLAFGAGLATGYFTWGNPSVQAAAPGNAAAALSTPAPIQRVSVTTDGNPSFGPADAPVTIVEFSDFECPYCRKWFTDTWPQLQQAYGSKIRLVYRDFPLTNIHPDAEPAAEAASCAGEQNQYWQFHDQLLNGTSLGDAVYLSYATTLKLDLTKFKDCLSSHRYQTDIQNDSQYGASLGITGTPTFFVNGIPMVGAQPFSAFKSIIDQELASTK
jgi:protein-disulfide isomerase